MMKNEKSFSEPHDKLQQQINALRVVVVVMMLGWLGTTVWGVASTSTAPTPAVLKVERLEIVEPDGTPAIVLANSQRPIAATEDGQLIMAGQEEERKGTPSITFFDGKGDEVGGMAFGNLETPDGYDAIRSLSFDAYGQDQTVVLSHYQNPDGSESGLSISNRPVRSMLETQAELGLEPGSTREQLSQAIDAALKDLSPEEQDARIRELFGTNRAFFGSSFEGKASLELKDGKGQLRVVIEAPEEGDPVLRFLDEEGNTVLQLPK